jgi:hypothetical protein
MDIIGIKFKAADVVDDARVVPGNAIVARCQLGEVLAGAVGDVEVGNFE